jgi:rhamnose transport system substrate-binding protein
MLAAGAAGLLLPRVSLAAAPIRVAIVAKSLGIGFFNAIHIGADQGAHELASAGSPVSIIFTGPTDTAAEAQIDVVNDLIAQHVDAIAIAANDPDALVPSCKRAMQRGIKVMSYDSAVSPEGRTLNLLDATIPQVGQVCNQLAASANGGKGKIAILSATVTSTNQNSWIEAIKQDLPNHPGLDLVTTVYGDDLSDRSYREATALLQKFPDLTVIVAISTVAITAAAKAVDDSGKRGRVFVTGLGLPSECAGAIHNGTMKSFAIWNPLDIGYGVAEVAAALVAGKAAPGMSVPAGHLGSITFDAAGNGTIGKPTIYDASNIDASAKLF